MRPPPDRLGAERPEEGDEGREFEGDERCVPVEGDERVEPESRERVAGREPPPVLPVEPEVPRVDVPLSFRGVTLGPPTPSITARGTELRRLPESSREREVEGVSESSLAAMVRHVSATRGFEGMSNRRGLMLSDGRRS